MKRVFALLLTAALLAAPVRAASEHGVTAEEASGGTVVLSVSSAPAGERVSGKALPLPGMDIATVRIEYEDKTEYAELGGHEFSFIMPDADVTVRAAFFSEKVWDGAVDISWYDPDETEYRLSTPAQLAGLAALVNGMTDVHTPEWLIKGERGLISCTAYPDVMLVGAGGGSVSDTVYCSEVDFAHKTVYLTADMDMGGAKDAAGAWSGPNWTPIGGKFSMDPEQTEGDSFVLDTRFNGVLDGLGHTVKNICCLRYAAKGFPYSMAIGLVGFLGGGGDVSGISADFDDGWQPAVRNVAVGSGYIYGRRMVAGVVGRIGKTSNGVIVENCANFADVLNTDAKGVGGIVGAGWGSGVIRNCYNAGSVSTVFSCPAGGICASNDGLDIYNCYNTGVINSNGALRGRAIGGHDSGSYSVINCYYLSGCDDDPASGGWYSGTAAAKLTLDVSALSERELKSPDFIEKLNGNGGAFAADTDGINDGFPVLWYQAGGSRETCEVSAAACRGGSVACSEMGSVPSGTLIQLSAAADTGYTLRYFTVNGKAIKGDFWTVTGDSEFGAEFAEIRKSTLHIQKDRDVRISVRRTGYGLDGGELTRRENEPLADGAVLLQENVITVTARGYDDAGPDDVDMEYTDEYVYYAENCESVKNGVFIVTGEGDVNISAVRGTRHKSWLSLADTGWYDRSGSYVISDAASLAGLALLVNGGVSDFYGETVTLGEDISLANTDGTVGLRRWPGIGASSEKAFRGTFDGAGHAISDMLAVSEGSSSAFFGFLKDAEVRDLTVFGLSSCPAAAAYAAGVAASAENSLLLRCDNRAEVRVSGSMAGGLCAHISGGTILRGCRNYGDVTAQCSVGGLAAVCYSGEDVIEDCFNFGTITAESSGSSGTGGVAGKLSGTMLRCGNAGDIVSADRYTGGLAGYTVGRRSSRIEDSRNTGSVRVSSAASNAAAGLLVGNAQYLTMTNCSCCGELTAPDTFPARVLDDCVGRAGSEAEISGLSPAEDGADFGYVPRDAPAAPKKDSFTAVFVADGKTVAELYYAPGDVSVDEPPLPQKEGYTGFWSPYRLGRADITVRAVYRPAEVSAGERLTEGRYALAYGSSGTLEIAENGAVTLTGSGEDMAIVLRRGAELTLDGCVLSGERTLITAEDGCRMIMRGENALIGLSEERNNAAPTLVFDGSLELAGEGGIRISARIGNSAIWSEGGVLTLSGGLAEIKKTDLLGFEGGAVNAGSVIVDGGSMLIYTDSDNVPAVCADSVRVTDGSLNVRCLHTEKVISGELSLAGGLVRLEGRSPNSSGAAEETLNETALNSFGGSGFMAVPSSVGSVRATDQRLVFNGETVILEAYNIDGSNYFKLRDIAALTDGTGSGFSVAFDPELRAVYARKGERYEYVGGERQSGEDKASTAAPSRWLLYVDGGLLPCDMAVIGGNNFFRLRDLGAAMDFGVDYVEQTRTVIVSSAD